MENRKLVLTIIDIYTSEMPTYSHSDKDSFGLYFLNFRDNETGLRGMKKTRLSDQ